MSAVELIRLYPESCGMILFAGFVVCWLLAFCTALLYDIMEAFRYKWKTARCIGIMTGQIYAKCHCRSCPNHKKCLHYERRSLVDILKIRKKKQACG